MIIVKLIGGLGNQLFQYSTGRALSDRLGSELVLDDSWFRGPFLRNTPRRLGLRSFNIRARWPKASERAWMLTCTGPLARLSLPRPWRLIRERHYRYDDALRHVRDGAYLSGYWQTERYFRDVRDLLLKDLVPRGAHPPGLHELMNAAMSATSLSVHVRRGDFVASARTAAYHGVLPLAYYEAAVAHVASRVGDLRIFVFSDDTAWAKGNLRFPYPTTFVERLSEDPAWEMLLMSKCRHHIVANSSFSWWGAWLDTSPGMVVAPRRWFRNEDIETDDLIPATWHRI